VKPRLSYDLRPCGVNEVRALCEAYHGYGGAGNSATYGFAVWEGQRVVAGYLWQPPPFGAAKSVCPDEPGAVLALSRMVATPRDERQLNHVAKPLKRQMRRLIDRGRWPILVTYSDEGQGHTGHVYKCSGWTPTKRRRARCYEDETGRRTSSYSNGVSGGRGLTFVGYTWIQRWEHKMCEPSEVPDWMVDHGWVRVPVEGKRWRSGNPAFRLEQRAVTC
jgi:hypothetical protein